MRDYIEKACEEIDAEIFSGDAFEDPGERKALAVYLGRWSRRLEGFEQPDETRAAASPEVERKDLVEAIRLASGVMDYCAGDAWERDCTREDREKFRAIYERLFPEVEEKPANTQSQGMWRCSVCNVSMPAGNLSSHLLGKKHRAALIQYNCESQVQKEQ